MTDDERLLANKQLVAKWFRTVPFGPGTNVNEAVDELVDEGYIQHNPFAGQGREGVKDFFTNFMPLPIKVMNGGETLHSSIFAEGDFVVRQDIRAEGMLIDIFRIENGRLKEHWDAFRPEVGAKRPRGF